MPRSGTKLLREMLNAHPNIRIPDIETDFLPYWVRNWALDPSRTTRTQFRIFYRRCLREPYFLQMAERNQLVSLDEWYDLCCSYSPSGVFEGLIRLTTGIPKDCSSIVWGDKSPSYIRHIPLLSELFPNGRFIHIVRDVRDYCLSIKRAWGKSYLRAAQRWQDDVSKAKKDGDELGASYMALRYEDLISSPTTVLTSVCDFIGLKFTEQMLTFRPPQQSGAAKGRTTVLRTNAGKYRTVMSPELVTDLEMLCCESLRQLNYPCHYSGQPVRIPDYKLRVLQIHDGLSTIRATARKRGILEALKFQMKYFKISGNRFK
jgi:hypothetical protein